VRVCGCGAEFVFAVDVLVEMLLLEREFGFDDVVWEVDIAVVVCICRACRDQMLAGADE
jgi:hypothetical protein